MKKNAPISILTNSESAGFSYNNVYAICFCILCTLVAYIYPALHNQFTNWDDPAYVTNNTIITTWNSGIFTVSVNKLWSPIQILLLTIEYHLFRLNPAGYHLISLLLHLCDVVLVFFVIFKLSRKYVVALIAALFFGIHPMQAESVMWVSDQKDVLFTLFYLAAMLTYYRYIELRNDAGRSKNKYLLLTIIFFILSCLSKSMGETLPVVLILMDSFAANNWNPKFILRSAGGKVIFFAIIAAYITARHMVLNNTSTIDMHQASHFTFTEQTMFACYALVIYVVKFIAPFSLSAFYPYPAKDADGLYPVIFYLSPFIVLISTGLIIWFIIRRKKNGLSNSALLFGLLFFIVNIYITLQLKASANEILADRYTYLSYFGLLFIAAGAINTFWEKYQAQLQKMTIASGCCVAIVFVLMANNYARTWYDSTTLWSHVIDVFRSSQVKDLEMAYTNRGIAYADQGRPDLTIADCTAAIKLNPGFYLAYYNRGIAYTIVGKSDLAESDFTTTTNLNPTCVGAYFSLGAAYFNKGKFDLAISNYGKAISLNPEYTEAYNNRGVIYSNEGQLDLAIVDYTKSIALNPNYAEAHRNRGLTYANMGKPDLAMND